VELIVGRLMTDEAFRAEFIEDPHAALVTVCTGDLRLSVTEIAALLNTDPTLWAEVADAIDPRLRKVSLEMPATSREGDDRVESSDRS
jgi:hypothetical protein